MAHESSACGNQVWHLFPTTSAEGSRRYVKQVMLRSDLYQTRKQAPYTGIRVRGSWSIQLCSSHSFSQFSFHVLSFNIGQELADNWFQKKIKMSYLNVTPKNYFQMKMFCIFYEKKKLGCCIIHSSLPLNHSCAQLPWWVEVICNINFTDWIKNLKLSEAYLLICHIFFQVLPWFPHLSEAIKERLYSSHLLKYQGRKMKSTRRTFLSASPRALLTDS